jgi:GH15 family glucan-1,4-alpha-glucosidase
MRYWLVGLLLIATPIAAQEHFHPPQDAQLHDQFYNTWSRPNGGQPRVASCCNKHDCYPTRIERRGASWYALRREDHAWIRIPQGLLEHEQLDPRESPDGQNHACIAPPQYGNVVYCAVLGSAI